MNYQDCKTKYDHLIEIIKSYKSAAVAFSGGVDSALLMKAAHEALGDRAIAITALSDLFPAREAGEAEQFCENEGIRHYTFHADEFSIEGFAENPPDRCYYCKKDIFSRIREIAREHGAQEVLEGSNMDDTGDFRPGKRAIRELKVKSPLQEAGLSKEEIRVISKELGLPTWNKQSFACLASRIPYGQIITAEKLSMIDQAEQILIDLGFHQLRVRIHEMGDAGSKSSQGVDGAQSDTAAVNYMCRIEVLPEELPKLAEDPIRTQINEAFRRIGFQYVTLDLQGYRTGSLNESLSEEVIQGIVKSQ